MRKPAQPPRMLQVTLVFVLTCLLIAAPMYGGAFIFAGEAFGLDVILHPQGYTGSESVLNIEVCIDPTTLVPAGSVITDMEIPIQNNVVVWNALNPTVGNALLGPENNIPSGDVDFESVALHELGHCIGLAHVNAASESGLTGNDRNYTKATDGANNIFDLGIGADGVRGTLDDIRGDDVNLHWYRTDTNDPGQLPLPAVIDSTTFARDVGSLPAGHLFAQNLDRDAAGTMGHPNTTNVKTEAVMQQGSFADEAQRELTADGVATIRLGMSGLDELQGTADDYVLNLTYGGISSAPSCDLTLRFTGMAGLAFCSTSSTTIVGSHRRITTAFMEYGVGFSWFFNQVPAGIFSDGFESGNTSAWSSTVGEN